MGLIEPCRIHFNTVLIGFFFFAPTHALEGFLFNTRPYSVYRADTYQQAVELCEQWWVAFTTICFYTQLNKDISRKNMNKSKKNSELLAASNQNGCRVAHHSPDVTVHAGINLSCYKTYSGHSEQNKLYIQVGYIMSNKC